MKQKQHGSSKKLNSIINPLMNIVDMYLDEEQNHYEESVAMNKFKNGGEKNHIFHDLLIVSHWIKENYTMKDWEEVPQEDLFEDGELTNEKAMIKAWDNIYYGKYKLVRRKND